MSFPCQTIIKNIDWKLQFLYQNTLYFVFKLMMQSCQYINRTFNTAMPYSSSLLTRMHDYFSYIVDMAFVFSEAHIKTVQQSPASWPLLMTYSSSVVWFLNWWSWLNSKATCNVKFNCLIARCLLIMWKCLFLSSFFFL